MSLSRVAAQAGPSSNQNNQSGYNLSGSRLEPNFQSDAYKEQAKEIFKRRMHYNPREAASRSRDRILPPPPAEQLSRVDSTPVVTAYPATTTITTNVNTRNA